ncbi:MAG: hypothetical protein CL878_14825, partial [Dehalococcoidia bacterium]|nr:hypothetical protein [Dehalococcoidia bacterium]
MSVDVPAQTEPASPHQAPLSTNGQPMNNGSGGRPANDSLSPGMYLLDALLSQVRDGMLIYHADGRVADINPAFSAITGFAREECVGDDPPFPWWPTAQHDLRMERLSRLLEDPPAGPVINQEALLTRTGEQLIVETCFAPLAPPKMSPTHFLEQLRVTPSRPPAPAGHLARLQNEILATLCHTLRPPVAFVLAYAELLAEWPASAGERQRMSHEILANARQMRVLVDDLLELSRLDETAAPQHFTSLDVPSLLDRACQGVASRMPVPRVLWHCTGLTSETIWFTLSRPQMLGD